MVGAGSTDNCLEMQPLRYKYQVCAGSGRGQENRPLLMVDRAGDARQIDDRAPYCTPLPIEMEALLLGIAIPVVWLLSLFFPRGDVNCAAYLVVFQGAPVDSSLFDASPPSLIW